MPITQDRMIRLIEASQELIAKYKRLIKDSEYIVKEFRDNPHIVEMLQNTIKEAAPSFDAMMAISQETGHFNTTRRKMNAKNAEYIKRQRRKAHEQRLEYELDDRSGIDLTAREQDDEQQSLTNYEEFNYEELLAHIANAMRAEGVDYIYYSDIARLITKTTGISERQTQLEIIEQLQRLGLMIPGEHTGELKLKAD